MTSQQMLKEGVVTVIYPERHSARVEFEDKNLTSAELPILTSVGLKNKCYHMPDIGESVICLFAGNAEGTGTGFIIGSRYHDKAPPATKNPDVTRLDFADGTFISYDRSTHELLIKCVGNVKILAKRIDLNE